MLIGFLLTLFVILCFLLVFIILMQQSKSSLGVAYMGTSGQTIFGGSGGQDVFQKITWVMAVLFMGGSLWLAMMKKPEVGVLEQLKAPVVIQTQAQEPETTLSSENNTDLNNQDLAYQELEDIQDIQNI